MSGDGFQTLSYGVRGRGHGSNKTISIKTFLGGIPRISIHAALHTVLNLFLFLGLVDYYVYNSVNF